MAHMNGVYDVRTRNKNLIHIHETWTMRTFYNASEELLFSLYCSMLMFLIGIENENWLNEITSVIHATLGMGMGMRLQMYLCADKAMS